MRRRATDSSHRGGTPQQLARKGELRLRIAVEAARLIAESGVRDYAFAKHKAAMRLGIVHDDVLPKNSEIDEALREHQRLFQAENRPALLRHLRETALEAMRFFAAFEPRLVGAVLEGTADQHSSVCLHLFSDDPDAPARFLDEQGIPHDQENRRVRLTRETYAEFPVLVFAAESVSIDLTVFPYDLLRQAPLDRIDEKPMRRATLSAVEQLLAI